MQNNSLLVTDLGGLRAIPLHVLFQTLGDDPAKRFREATPAGEDLYSMLQFHEDYLGISEADRVSLRSWSEMTDQERTLWDWAAGSVFWSAYPWLYEQFRSHIESLPAQSGDAPMLGGSRAQ